MTNYTEYLGLKHSYIKTNCITLIEKIYKEQLNSEIFSNLRTLNLKSNRIGDDGARCLANSKTLKITPEVTIGVSIRITSLVVVCGLKISRHL